jgi:hypothetical protein
VQLVITVSVLKVLMIFANFKACILVLLNRCKPINITIIDRRKKLIINTGAGLLITANDERNIKHESNINIYAPSLLSDGFSKFILDYSFRVYNAPLRGF